MITTADAAQRLGVSDRRVRQLIRSGLLPAVRLGRDWLIEPAALAQVAGRPKRGWPKGRPRRVPPA